MREEIFSSTEPLEARRAASWAGADSADGIGMEDEICEMQIGRIAGEFFGGSDGDLEQECGAI